MDKSRTSLQTYNRRLDIFAATVAYLEKYHTVVRADIQHSSVDTFKDLIKKLDILKSFWEIGRAFRAPPPLPVTKCVYSERHRDFGLELRIVFTHLTALDGILYTKYVSTMWLKSHTMQNDLSFYERWCMLHEWKINRSNYCYFFSSFHIYFNT